MKITDEAVDGLRAQVFELLPEIEDCVRGRLEAEMRTSWEARMSETLRLHQAQLEALNSELSRKEQQRKEQGSRVRELEVALQAKDSALRQMSKEKKQLADNLARAASLNQSLLQQRSNFQVQISDLNTYIIRLEEGQRRRAHLLITEEDDDNSQDFFSLKVQESKLDKREPLAEVRNEATASAKHTPRRDEPKLSERQRTKQMLLQMIKQKYL